MADREIKIHVNCLKGELKPFTIKATTYNKPMHQLMTVIRKKAQRDESTPLFLYFKQCALYPDSTFQDLVNHNPEATDFDVICSFDVCFG